MARSSVNLPYFADNMPFRTSYHNAIPQSHYIFYPQRYRKWQGYVRLCDWFENSHNYTSFRL